MHTLLAQVQAFPDRGALERRTAPRYPSPLEATSRPLDAESDMLWGARLNDISTTGIGLVMCYPFRTGTYLAIDLKDQRGAVRTMMARVANVRDQADGTWIVGCELVKPLTDSELEIMI